MRDPAALRLQGKKTRLHTFGNKESLAAQTRDGWIPDQVRDDGVWYGLWD
jgi:hypothetical protein